MECPRTAFTFDYLNTFHLLTLQGKLNLYDYYKAILRKMDNTGLEKQVYRWNEVSMVVRQWRHLKSIKRAGRGHDPAGIAVTKPVGWESLLDSERWLYWQISTCESELNAVKQAYSKGTYDGLSITGVVGVKCARHCFVLPNGIGDLQKGEQYCNVNYVALSALKAGCVTEDGRALANIGFLHDIACNWYKNFYKRLEDMPEDMQILDDVPTCTMIPKAHIEGHGPKCRTTWSFNFLRRVGRTHGETVEQEWVHIGQVSISTREMGPAACHSVLDDHWSAWNWCKLVDLESHLVKHLAEALLMMAKQKAIAEKFTSTFSPATIEKWHQMVAEWDQDKTKPDPYVEPSASMMMAMIRLELAEEEAIEAMRGEPQLHEKLTASTFLRLGLELEERQWALCIKGEGVLRNPLKKATLQEKQNPAIAAIHGIDSLADTADAQIVHAEMLRLYLPSELMQAQCDVGCHGIIVDKEHRFHMAQVEDALEDIHHLHRIYAGLLAKYRNVAGTGQKANTRSKTNIRAFNLKIALAIARYHDARRALLVLDPDGEWKTRFQEFKDGDNRGPAREENERSEGHYEPSWIWLIARRTSRDRTTSAPQDFASTQEPADVAQDSTSMEDSTAPEDNNDHLHVEWAKTVTRADRWEEEWKTLVDEMHRSLESLTKKAMWWMAQGPRCEGRTDIVAGCCAYAAKQASIRLQLIQKWVKRWQPVLTRARIAHGWINPYLPASLRTANVCSPAATSAPPSDAVSPAANVLPSSPDADADAVFTVESQNGSAPDADDPSRYGCDDSESDWADDDGPVEVGDARDDNGGFDSD
ncbi:hypothetical protein SCP_1600550 [Sparassis crispa]|uniref:CxC2-like cysteine cluster KDZ transposase-associated domain-containing protein n=1 Tax=Sparassis crispa TaxID=139825 RepID=A0A401H4P7_9APHY|nr:hypothetical protein SCP_1600550 [Sparassis crispa]GBE89394.1 hypothetical protein SCP_1600550 [Sparassis crispa]